MKTIVVVDGMGGGIGAQVISRVRELVGDRLQIIALGTNSAATERMLKAGADRGASGENAIRVSVSLGDAIVGPIGIILPNAMLGEITADVAGAVLGARGERFLIPVPQDHFVLVGVESSPVGRLATLAAEMVVARLDAGAS